MKLQDLLLKKEELPILHETCFYIPVHPKLLDSSLSFNSSIAKQVFPSAAQEWHQDLKEYAQTANLESKTKEWYESVFLSEEPKIEIEYGSQVLNVIGWKDDTSATSNGFVRCFSINRNIGGSLYFNPGEYEFETCVNLKEGSEAIRFSKEKIKEFAIRTIPFGNGEEGALFNIYRQHNIDYYPGALFLRNWAIAYMNAVFEKHKNIFER